MAERSFKKEVEKLRLGEGEEFHGEGILAVTKALIESGVSLDQRLRESIATREWRTPGPKERQEHLALLARWYYSSWREGEWVGFESPEHAPFRRLVRLISRVAASGRRS